MAEALAIAAAVVQFLDIGLRLSTKLGGLVSELHDAPNTLHRLKSDLDQQISMTQHIQSSYPIFWSTSIKSPSAVTLQDKALVDYTHTMEQLVSVIQSVHNEAEHGAFRKSWNAIRVIHKRKEIELLCDHLERQKSTMMLWLTNANAYVNAYKINDEQDNVANKQSKLSLELKQLVGEIQPRVKEIQDVVTRLDKAAYQANCQLRHLPRLLQMANSTSTDINRLTNGIETLEQVNTNLVEEWKILASTVM